MNHLRIITLLAITVWFASGCVTATVNQVRQSATGMNEEDALVVIGRRNRPSQTQTELDFIDCVSRNIGGRGNEFTVISEQEFMDSLFPWFEPRTAPLDSRELPELMRRPALAERLREIGLKYLVWVEGTTRRTSESGSLSCTATPGGAGCFGFLTWENDSSYEASVWNTRTGRTAGRVSSDAEGTSYIPAIVIPIPLIARVEKNACQSLADQLKVFITSSG